MGRYINSKDVITHLELCNLDEINNPKLSTVEEWIEGSESEVDKLTNNRWDEHTITDELITPDCQTNEFLLAVRPLVSITSLYYQNGDEWDNEWVLIPATDYRIVNPNISKIKTKEYHWKTEGLKVTYVAGYSTIPVWLKELSLLTVEKRYIMSRLGIAAGDTETLSVATLRIQDKSSTNLRYRLTGLQKEIDDRIRLLGKSMKAKNYSIGYMTSYTTLPKRWRMH